MGWEREEMEEGEREEIEGRARERCGGWRKKKTNALCAVRAVCAVYGVPCAGYCVPGVVCRVL